MDIKTHYKKGYKWITIEVRDCTAELEISVYTGHELDDVICQFENVLEDLKDKQEESKKWT